MHVCLTWIPHRPENMGYLSFLAISPESLLPSPRVFLPPAVLSVPLYHVFSTSMSPGYVLGIYIKPRTHRWENDICLKGWLNLPSMIISYCSHFPANDMLHFSLQLKTIPHYISIPHFLYSLYVGEHFLKTGHCYRAQADLKQAVLIS